MTKAVNTLIVHLVLTLCILCFCGCSLHQDNTMEESMHKYFSVPAAEKDSTYFSHVVKWQGENLSKISMWYTGSVKNWLRLQEINSAIDPKRMKIGDIVLIPEDLISTREPMPREFSGTNNKMKKKPEPETVTELSADGIEPLLFGPIDTPVEDNGEAEEGGLSLSLETID